MKNTPLPTSGAASLDDQPLFICREGRWYPNPKLLRSAFKIAKTYTTKQVLALLNLPNANRLHAAKKLGLPYLHSATDLESNRIVVAIKKDTWMIFRPC